MIPLFHSRQKALVLKMTSEASSELMCLATELVRMLFGPGIMTHEAMGRSARLTKRSGCSVCDV
jgi:hypothetical protein